MPSTPIGANKGNCPSRAARSDVARVSAFLGRAAGGGTKDLLARPSGSGRLRFSLEPMPLLVGLRDGNRDAGSGRFIHSPRCWWVPW